MALPKAIGAKLKARAETAPGCQPCDLCGDRGAELVLRSNRLDGPLMRCLSCLLYFVAYPDDNGGVVSGVHAGTVEDRNGTERDATREMARLAQRALELNLVQPAVEECERPWRETAARERVGDLSRFVTRGRLLEVGSSRGELLAAARDRFDATGVEADLASSRVARERGLVCRNGTLGDAGFDADRFDVAALYHTIEHLPSPSRTLIELHRIIRPGGLLVIETPNIATAWFTLLGSRWRQLIPDHRYFFTPKTIDRMCRQTGFEIQELRSVGKAMSIRLFASRVGRYHRTLGRAFSQVARLIALEERTLRLNLGDVMRLYAVRK